jgi:site-specific DNA recombinase
MKKLGKGAAGPIAGVYARISQEDQSQYSLPSQQQACEALAAAKGFQTCEAFTFIDNGGLSIELDRRGLAGLRAAVKSGAIKAVVIHSLDRLSRKVVHQLLLLEEFRKNDVEVHFVDTPNEDSPEGRMLLTIKGLFSEYEREKLRERTIRGSRQRAREGKVNHRPPFGYMTTKDGFLIPHPERTEIVRRVFKLIIEGNTCGAVAQRLNDEGVPGPAGKRWIRGVVLQVVRRDAYCTGRLPWGRTTAAEPSRRRKPARPGKSKLTSFKRRPQAEWLHISIPVIIEPAMFDAAQRAIAANRKWKSGRPSQTYLLTGIVRCGRCGAAICGSYSHGYPYYRCCGVDPVTGRRACGERGIRLEAIEPQIWRDVVDTLSNRARLAALLNARFAEAAATETDHAIERAALTDQIEKLHRREFRCRQAMLDADLSDSFAAFREDLRQTIQRRQEAQRRLESITPARQPAQPESFSEFCRQMRRARQITDRAQQRDFLRACVEQITVAGDEVNLQFSLNLPAAMAAIEQSPEGNDGPGTSGRNCQPSQRPALYRPKDGRRQSRIAPQRAAPQSHRSGHHPARRGTPRRRRLLQQACRHVQPGRSRRDPARPRHRRKLLAAKPGPRRHYQPFRALAHRAAAPSHAGGHPQIEYAVEIAETFERDANCLRLISLYEQRTFNLLQRQKRELEAMQSAREQKRQTALAESMPLYRHAVARGETWNPEVEARANGGFVFSPSLLEEAGARQSRLQSARVSEPGLFTQTRTQPFRKPRAEFQFCVPCAA